MNSARRDYGRIGESVRSPEMLIEPLPGAPAATAMVRA